MSLHAKSRFSALLLAAVLGTACNEQEGVGFQTDQTPPTVAISKTAGDTLQLVNGIEFAIQGSDNLGLKDLNVTLSVGFDFVFDTTFSTAISTLNLPFAVPLPANTTAGGTILITATITDGNNNQAQAVDSIFLVNDQALTVRILDPVGGAVTAPDRQLPINIRASQLAGVQRVGYTTTGVVTAADSAGFALPDTALFQTTLMIPANTQNGQFTIVGFAVDSAGRRATSSSVLVNVQSVISDNNPPRVTFTVAKRVEVTDSITVSATDPSGITLVGWLGLNAAGTVVGGDSTTGSGVLTQLNQTYSLALNFTTFPQLVEIQAFAVDGAGNRGEARRDTSLTSAIRRDTVTVVNGITKPLPAGGSVADAIYNPNQNELLLTNSALNRVEIFRIADTSYVAGGILTGSRPWGIALWPRDTLGANGDTVVVALSGGTNLGIIDVSPGGRVERRRHALPNFIIQSVQTEIDPATGTVKIKVESFDFSDRPQYLGTTCRTTGGTACAPDSVFAVYSTTPTPGQTPPFEDRGTVRWENLTAGTPHSHFFWEHAAKAPSPEFDSLQIFIDRGPNVAQETILSVAKGVMVDLDELPFANPTFVRSSGNSTHAIIGEGGSIGLARAIGYDGNATLNRTNDCTVVVGTTICGPSEEDLGISPGIRVRDFIANTATEVRSVAINFNGLTNLVRADSVYLLDEGLRLAGTIPVTGINAGMDINFQHSFDPFTRGTGGFGGTLDPNLRMVFLARADANIDVFDTFFFGRVTTIPIRDPIIGPLRVALLPSGNQVLVGVTVRGVVTVQFPQITNIFPAVDGDDPAILR